MVRGAGHGQHTACPTQPRFPLRPQPRSTIPFPTPPTPRRGRNSKSFSKPSVDTEKRSTMYYSKSAKRI